MKPLLLVLGAIFQFSVSVETEKQPATALLWIPADAARVRGLVVAGTTLMERQFVKDPQIRQACAEQSLGLLYLKCSLGAVNLQKVLDDLAEKSGYPELTAVPLFFVGHSAGGPPAKDAALKFRDRCFGLIQYRGGGPWDGKPLPAGLPSLTMVGQFDEFGGTMRSETGREQWERMLEPFRAFRAAEPARTVTLAVEPGAGHFAWSDRNGRLAALFIRKAAQAIGRRLDHTAGWLTDSHLKQPQAPPAPYAEFTGDAATANWHFDREMAEAIVAYHHGLTGKRDQFLRWKNPCWVDAGTRYFFHNIVWVGDGQTFEVEPVYADTYPTPQPGGGPRWALAGQPAGHSAAPIRVRPVSGPIEAVGPNRLRFRFDSVSAVPDGYRATFLAYSDGDADYRYTELVGMLPRGFKGLTEGRDQTITFPPLPDVRATGEVIELQATSDAGLPVEYYVAWGPATVQDGRLHITEVPARARYPIEVKVVAWQFGRGVDPRVKAAAPVERTFWIRAP